MNIVYRDVNRDPGYKPEELLVTVIKDEYRISKTTYGPRGGVYMQSHIDLSREEFQAIAKAIEERHVPQSEREREGVCC